MSRHWWGEKGIPSREAHGKHTDKNTSHGGRKEFRRGEHRRSVIVGHKEGDREHPDTNLERQAKAPPAERHTDHAQGLGFSLTAVRSQWRLWGTLTRTVAWSDRHLGIYHPSDTCAEYEGDNARVRLYYCRSSGVNHWGLWPGEVVTEGRERGSKK